MAIPARDIVKGPPELKGLTRGALEQLFLSLGEKKYRAHQLYDALYINRLESIDDMVVLPAAVRATLAATYRMQSVALQQIQHSDDGTKKFLFDLYDGRSIESVLIPTEKLDEDGKPHRLTLCVSTQVGCNLGCKFCATATLNLARNLTAGEIVDQYLQAQAHSEEKITNLVFMGMGEPMQNYDNVMAAVEIFTDQRTDMIVPRRVTISTAGVIPGIMRMADEGKLIKLAVSLHATTQGVREKLMPIAKKYTLSQLGDALEYYYRKTHKGVTFEYILFDGINDGPDDVKRLAKYARRVPTRINIIPFHEIDFTNPVGFAAELRPTPPDRFEWFLAQLRAEGANVIVRSSSGLDIDAACGQLALSGGH